MTFVKKTTNYLHQISKIYFVIKLYMFRASPVHIIRSYLLYARQLVRFMQVMWPLPNRVRLDIWCIYLVVLYEACHDERSLERKQRWCQFRVIPNVNIEAKLYPEISINTYEVVLCSKLEGQSPHLLLLSEFLCGVTYILILMYLL